jgi:beta-phosphoglucomutase family hydrolase
VAGSSLSAAVLFDLDGVIVDSREFHMQAWEQWARDFAVEHAPAYFHDMFGRRNDAIIGGLLPDIDPERLRELAAHKEELFRSLALGNVVALPGVVRLLQALDERGIRRAIVTSTPRANLDVILESLGLAERFHALVAEEDARLGKPDPEGFLVAAQRLDVVPESSVVIEDAPAGLQAAAAAGMRSIGVTTTHAAAALTDATIVVDTLADDAVLQFILRPE